MIGISDVLFIFHLMHQNQTIYQILLKRYPANDLHPLILRTIQYVDNRKYEYTNYICLKEDTIRS